MTVGPGAQPPPAPVSAWPCLPDCNSAEMQPPPGAALSSSGRNASDQQNLMVWEVWFLASPALDETAMENQLEHLAQPSFSTVHDSAGEIISRDTRLSKLFLALPHFAQPPEWPPALKG